MAIDGDAVVIGAYGDDDDGANAGSAYVFTRSGANWTQDDKLKGTDAGSAYLFRNSGGDWSQEANISASDKATNLRFGHSVSLSGNTAVVGQCYGSSGVSAYVFKGVYDESWSWTQKSKITASDGEEGDSETASAISGQTIAVAAVYDDSGAGSVCVTGDVLRGGLKQSFTLNQTGNQEEVVTNDLIDTQDHNAANEITGVDSDTTNVAHDAAGNMTKIPKFDNSTSTVIGHLALSYDAWNRLVKVETDHATPATLAVMTYDGTNRRATKVITNSGTDWNHTYHFYYDGHSMIETRNVSDEVIKQKVWGMTYIDELIQIGINTDPGADDDEGTGGTQDNCDTFRWAVQDANYNVIGLVDSDGDLVERYEYTPYGRRRVFINGGSDPLCTTEAPHTQGIEVTSTANGAQVFGLCEIGHQGLMHDKEFGLIYNRARYLQPVLGIYTGPDPKRYVDGMNYFEDRRSNPVRYGDPSGTDARVPIRQWGEIYEQSGTGHDEGTNVHLEQHFSVGMAGGKHLGGGFSLGRKTWDKGKGRWNIRVHGDLGGGVVPLEDVKRWAANPANTHTKAAFQFFFVAGGHEGLKAQVIAALDRMHQWHSPYEYYKEDITGLKALLKKLKYQLKHRIKAKHYSFNSSLKPASASTGWASEAQYSNVGQYGFAFLSYQTWSELEVATGPISPISVFHEAIHVYEDAIGMYMKDHEEAKRRGRHPDNSMVEWIPYGAMKYESALREYLTVVEKELTEPTPSSPALVQSAFMSMFRTAAPQNAPETAGRIKGDLGFSLSCDRISKFYNDEKKWPNAKKACIRFTCDIIKASGNPDSMTRHRDGWYYIVPPDGLWEFLK